MDWAGGQICNNTRTENNLRCAVVPGGDDCTVVLVVKCSTAEIDHSHCCALHRSLISLLNPPKKQETSIQTDFEGNTTAC